MSLADRLAKAQQRDRIADVGLAFRAEIEPNPERKELEGRAASLIFYWRAVHLDAPPTFVTPTVRFMRPQNS